MIKPIKRPKLPPTATRKDTKQSTRMADQETERARKVAELKEKQREIHRIGTSGPGVTTYSYQRGPDGVPYAVDATTYVDTTPVPGDSEATRRKLAAIEQQAMMTHHDVYIQAAEDLRSMAEAEERSKSGTPDAERINASGTSPPPSAPPQEYEESSGQDMQPDDRRSEQKSRARPNRLSRQLVSYKGTGLVKSLPVDEASTLLIKAK